MGFAAVAVVLIGVDATFMAVGRHDKNVALFVTWFGVQALVCIVAGTFQGVRGRNWWEIVVVAPIASMLLAFIILAPSLTDTANLGLALGPPWFPGGCGEPEAHALGRADRLGNACSSSRDHSEDDVSIALPSIGVIFEGLAPFRRPRIAPCSCLRGGASSVDTSKRGEKVHT
jgi:hypothetical protein